MMMLLLSSCEGSAEEDRQEQQRLVRAERLARARARRARLARLQQRRPRDPAPVAHPRPWSPHRKCDPAEELGRRAAGSASNDRFALAVHLVLQPIRADLVKLKGIPFQRFTFTVRMHPDDAPRFGRRARRAILELDLRFTPLCGSVKPTPKPQTLRVRLVRTGGKKNDPRVTTSLWPHRPGSRPFVVPVGKLLQLILDPTQATLSPGRNPAPVVTPLGAWEIQAARFAGRPRTQRLSLPTSQLPDNLRGLHVVEVQCDRHQNKRCRFLTRQQGRRAVVTPWMTLLKLAAPIQSAKEVQQLHAAALSLRFGQCGGDVRRASKGRGRHLCFGGRARLLPCQFWRALNGYGNEAVVTPRGDGFHVQQVIACQGKTARVLLLEAFYERKGSYSQTVTDLTPRTAQLLDGLRRLTSPRRRRR